MNKRRAKSASGACGRRAFRLEIKVDWATRFGGPVRRPRAVGELRKAVTLRRLATAHTRHSLFAHTHSEQLARKRKQKSTTRTRSGTRPDLGRTSQRLASGDLAAPHPEPSHSKRSRIGPSLTASERAQRRRASSDWSIVKSWSSVALQFEEI